MMKDGKLSGRIWFNVILFGFMGQVAWNVENMYFNTFLYNRVGGSPKDVSAMVAASAVTAVATTFLMGALSDKLGRRKPFICVGYILWGLTVTVFGFISREHTAALTHMTDQAKILAVTVSAVIVMDCVMTFMGSTCNDAAFNAWITDSTGPENRGAVESVNSILPVAAMVLVTVGFGAGATALGYEACFFGLGALVAVCGAIGLFTLKDPPALRRREGAYLENVTYGFRPRVIKENARLYLLLAAQCLGAIASQVVMPYLLIYVQHYLGFDFNSAIGVLTEKPIVTVAAALGLGVFVAAVVAFGKLTDKIGRMRFLLPAAALQAVGLALVFPMRSIFTFALAAGIYGLGMLAFGIVMSAAVRDNTPPERVGAFQGVRMIFVVLLPMVIGPAVGAAVITRFSPLHALGTYINDYGEAVPAPVPEIFLFAAGFALLIAVPAAFLLSAERRKKRARE